MKLLLWGGGSIFLLLGVLVCIYMFFGWRARVNLENKVAALIAAGEPLTVAMLQPPRVDDSINAAADVRAAIALLPGETDAKTKFNNYRDGPNIPLRDDERALLIPYAAENADALAALRPALAKPRAVSQVKLTTPLITVLLPQLNSIRELANASANNAYLLYDAGEHGRALEELSLLEPLARVAGSEPILISSLVAIGVRAMGASRVMELAPELKIGEKPGDASPVQVRAMIDGLMDTTILAGEFKMGLKGERLMQLDTLQNIAGGTLSAAGLAGPGPAGPGGAASFLARPLVYSNAADCLDMMGDYLKATAAADMPAAKTLLIPVEQQANALAGKTTNLFTSLLMPSLSRAFETHFRVRTDANLAAAALAIRWYQLDHAGAYPESLEALVPKYLPAVPTDYLSGKPVRYRAEGEQPMLWSVGSDGVDDEGSVELKNPSRSSTWLDDRWQMKDAVVYLNRQPRPTTQPDQ